MAVLCASIGHVLTRYSGTTKKLSASESKQAGENRSDFDGRMTKMQPGSRSRFAVSVPSFLIQWHNGTCF
jgi:hypothetical protein